MPEISASQMGGTMRLGVRPTLLHNRPDGSVSLARDLYGRHLKSVNERHRHRYEVNPDMVERLQSAGLLFTGRDERNTRMEIVELDRKYEWVVLRANVTPIFRPLPTSVSGPPLSQLSSATRSFLRLSITRSSKPTLTAPRRPSLVSSSLPLVRKKINSQSYVQDNP